MKKKSLALALSLALIAVVGIGSTFAYFTDNDTKTNVVTMGHVDISLHEHTDADGKEDEVNEIKFTNIVPNEVVVKNADVKVNDRSEDCYVRVKVEFKGLDNFKEMPKLTTADGWEYNKNDDYFYFVDDEGKDVALKADNGGHYDFLESVTMPNWDNAAADKTFSIILSAEAVQANFNDKVEWPTGDAMKKYNPSTSTSDTSYSGSNGAESAEDTPASTSASN